MKIRDFILPKHQHSDPKIRRQAVQHLSDMQTLLNIIERDRDHDVRRKAARRLFELKKERQTERHL